LSQALFKRAPLLVDTITFTSSGIDEYKKVIENVIIDSINEAGEEINKYITKLVEDFKNKNNNYESVMVYVSAIVRELNTLFSKVNLDNIIDSLVNQIKANTTEQFDEGVLRQSVMVLIRDNERLLKEKATMVTNVVR
ncbi:MAG: FAD-linked oxidase, partial [Stygiolobus sp.]|nr:FAD-linked oxidase [Stygiolobus sp.]